MSFVIALSTIGLDLSSFAILGGAIGVGIGFGLQKVVSNLVSGLILLIDRSIKPGDAIEIEGTYGWINSLRARYACNYERRKGTFNPQRGLNHQSRNQLVFQ